MTGQIVIQSSPSTNNRRQPLLPPAKCSNVGEFAGGTAAECAAICCCCPCVVMGCFVLAIYKVPIGICRRIWRERQIKKKKKMRKDGLLKVGEGGGRSTIHCLDDDDVVTDIHMKDFEIVKVSVDGSAAVIDLDRQMWEQFNNTGFWRSPSQRYL